MLLATHRKISSKVPCAMDADALHPKPCRKVNHWALDLPPPHLQQQLARSRRPRHLQSSAERWRGKR